MFSSTRRPEQPIDLLEQVRAAGPQGLSDFIYRIAIASAAPEPGLNPAEAAPPGQAIARANLLAYREIIAFDRTGVVEGLAKNVPQATHQVSEIYARALRFDVARALLKVYMARWPAARALGAALPIIGDTSGPADGFRDRKGIDVQVVAKPGATTTFVAFCGLRHVFGIQLNILHHCCLAKQNVNAVYLRDFSQNLYLTGIESLGNVEETLGKLRDHFSRLGTRKLVFIGSSGGVFGALHYGSMLGANLHLLFGGPTSLDIGVEEERQAFVRLHRLHDEGKVEWPDLRTVYAQGDSRVSLYFAADRRVDRLQAENMAGLPGVQLNAVPTKHHFVMDVLAASGELDRIFAAAAE